MDYYCTTPQISDYLEIAKMTQNLPNQESPELYQNEVNSHDLVHNLVDLYWFLQVIDAGSFSIAANNHGISKSNLSRRLSQLETRLGVQLLHRNPRFLSLTGIGADVYRHTLEMIEAGQKATDSVQRALGTPSGKVTIVLPSILSNWLMPVLLNFNNTYKHIQLTLQTADSTQDINSQSIDLALSLFKAPEDSSQIVARPLATLSFVNVISTSFKNTEQASQILVNNPANTVNNENNRSLLVNNYLNALEAAVAGFGYASLPLCACNSAISSGELKYYNDKDDSRTLFSFTQPHRGITLATRVLLDYLTLHISQSRTLGIIPIKQSNGDQ